MSIKEETGIKFNKNRVHDSCGPCDHLNERDTLLISTKALKLEKKNQHNKMNTV